jgi:teichuronic acid biosynthesis glycosyltransferase TuaC
MLDRGNDPVQDHSSGLASTGLADGEARTLKVLTVSTVFPNPLELSHGVFVRSRMRRVADLVRLKVIAPLAALDYSNPKKGWFRNWSVPPRREDEGIEVFHPRWFFPPLGTPLNPLCLCLRLLGPMARLRRTFRFDLIDAHFASPDGIATALLATFFRCPFLVTLRGNETEFARGAMGRRLMAWALCRASRVIAVSEDLRRFAVSLGVPGERTKTISNGVDIDRFYPRDWQASRRKFGIAPGARVILSAGGLVERKGHHRAVEALGMIREQGVDACLMIVGGAGREGLFEQRIRQTVSSLGLDDRVRFMGSLPQDGLAEAMSAADVFCLASSMEGSPNVVHEAQACGSPVVAFGVGGVPDLLPSERYGTVVAPNDVPALAVALGEALGRSWDRKAIAEWGRSRSWNQVAREVVEQMRMAMAEYVRN